MTNLHGNDSRFMRQDRMKLEDQLPQLVLPGGIPKQNARLASSGINLVIYAHSDIDLAVPFGERSAVKEICLKESHTVPQRQKLPRSSKER